MARNVPAKTAALGLAFALTFGAALAQTERGPKNQRAIDGCVERITESYDIRLVVVNRVRENNNRRWVYGRATARDEALYAYRCMFYADEVRELQVLVDPDRDTPDREAEWIDLLAPGAVLERDVETDAPETDAPETAETPETVEPTAEATSGPAPATREVYRVNWGESYEPEGGITCYKKRRACYRSDGKLDIAWTGREFSAE